MDGRNTVWLVRCRLYWVWVVGAVARGITRGIDRWADHTTPPCPENLYDLSASRREMWRRGEMLSYIIGALLLCDGLAIAGLWRSPVYLGMLVFAGMVFLLAIALNHSGYVDLAGLLVVGVMGLVVHVSTQVDIVSYGGVTWFDIPGVMLWVGILYVAFLVLQRRWVVVVTVGAFTSQLLLVLGQPQLPNSWESRIVISLLPWALRRFSSLRSVARLCSLSW